MVAALSEGDVAEEEHGTAPDVPVFTDVTEQKHRLYVRIGIGTMLQGNSNVGHADRHAFLVRAIHETMGVAITVPSVELPRVAGVVDALSKWAPLEPSHMINFISAGNFPRPAIIFAHCVHQSVDCSAKTPVRCCEDNSANSA